MLERLLSACRGATYKRALRALRDDEGFEMSGARWLPSGGAGRGNSYGGYGAQQPAQGFGSRSNPPSEFQQRLGVGAPDYQMTKAREHLTKLRQAPAPQKPSPPSERSAKNAFQNEMNRLRYRQELGQMKQVSQHELQQERNTLRSTSPRTNSRQWQHPPTDFGSTNAMLDATLDKFAPTSKKNDTKPR